MSISRSKVSQNFTVLNNSVINDPEFDSRYLGTFLRLISKGEGWEISAHGLASLYPTNGVDFYRNAFKHMCKLGYMVRIPQPKVNGQYQKVLMELYDHRQIESNLSDEDVEKLFSKEELSTEEIQKIYPKRVSRYGEVEGVNPTQQRTDKTSSTKTKETTTAPPDKPDKDKEDVVVYFSDKGIVEFSKEGLNLSQETLKQACGVYTQKEIDLAIQRTLGTKNRESDTAVFLHWLKNPEKWVDVTSKEDLVAKNKEHLESLNHLDGKTIALTNIDILYNGISFTCYPKYTSFKIDQKDFIFSVNKHLEKLNNFEKLHPEKQLE